MKTIPEMLEMIHRIKGIQEASWNGKSYDMPWGKVLNQLVTDPVENSIMFILLNDCWNDCEDWLAHIKSKALTEKNQAKPKKETPEQIATKAEYARIDAGATGKGRTNTYKGSSMEKFNNVEFTVEKDPDNSALYICRWPDETKSYLYPHEIELILP